MCAVTEWYKSVFKEDLSASQAASKILHKLETLKSVGDAHALKELASLPWEDHSILARISIVRGLWSLTRLPDFQPHFISLRDRIHASFVADFGTERADHLLRGLYAPGLCAPFSDKEYAVRENET